MSTHTVEARDLRVSYGSRPALALTSLKIPVASGVIGLFGPNGAGKSTLIRTIAGDISTYSGKLVKPERVAISYLPDEPFLYPWLSVEQCSELFSNRHNDFRPEVFEEFLAGSNITLSVRVAALSKGMSERLHLALIMSRAPELYVLDEPLGGVDPVARDHLLDLIQRLRTPSTPLLLSTHLINGVDRIFDDVILIADGQLIAHDSAQTLRDLGDGNLENAYKRSMANR